MKAASQAGFSDIKIAAEPTAAAVAYQDENCEDGESILVYDFWRRDFRCISYL